MHSCRKSGKYRKLKEESRSQNNTSSCFHVFRGNENLRLKFPEGKDSYCLIYFWIFCALGTKLMIVE